MRLDWIARIAAGTATRRQIGLLGANLLAALAISAPARGQESRGDKPVSSGRLCQPGLTRCGKKCVDTRTNPRHCGGCFNRCGQTESCCPECDGVCIPGRMACGPHVCEPCNETTCGPGEYCCNYSCSVCRPRGKGCTRIACGKPCGTTTCGPGEYCCNPSCGICARDGQGCPEIWCEPDGELCGNAICPPGEVCCNASCSMCAPPDTACIQIACEE